jgi:hypothetical protein
VPPILRHSCTLSQSIAIAPMLWCFRFRRSCPPQRVCLGLALCAVPMEHDLAFDPKEWLLAPPSSTAALEAVQDFTFSLATTEYFPSSSAALRSGMIVW